MQFKKILMMLLFLALIGNISFAVAQDEEENEGIAQVVLITPKNGEAKALEDAITAYHHYVADKEGAFRWQWFAILTGPDTGSYIARTGSHDWADFDATHDWDEEAAANFASNVQPHIDSVTATMTRTDRDLGIWPDSLDGYNYFSVTRWTIKQGKDAAFKEGLKKIDATLKEGGWPTHYGFNYPVSGGKGNQITLVSPRKNFADMAPKEPEFIDVLNSAMGEEEAGAFLSEWRKTYYAGQNLLVKLRPKLSDYGDSD